MQEWLSGFCGFPRQHTEPACLGGFMTWWLGGGLLTSPLASSMHGRGETTRGFYANQRKVDPQIYTNHRAKPLPEFLREPARKVGRGSFVNLLRASPAVLLLAAVMTACEKDPPVAPFEGILSGEWEGSAFHYSGSEFPDTYLRVFIAHHEYSISWHWRVPSQGINEAMFDGERVSVCWFQAGGVRVEFRGELTSPDTLKGDWLATFPDSQTVADRWYLARLGSPKL